MAELASLAEDLRSIDDSNYAKLKLDGDTATVDAQVEKINKDLGLDPASEKALKWDDVDKKWKFGGEDVGGGMDESYLKDNLERLFPGKEAETIKANARDNRASKEVRDVAADKNEKAAKVGKDDGVLSKNFGPDGNTNPSALTKFFVDCATKLFGAGFYAAITIEGLNAMALAKSGCWLMDEQMSPPSPLTQLTTDTDGVCSCASPTPAIKDGCSAQCTSILGPPRVAACTDSACSCVTTCPQTNSAPPLCTACIAGYTGTPPNCICGDACKSCLGKNQNAACTACADGFDGFPDCNAKVPPAVTKNYKYEMKIYTWQTVLGSLLNQAGYYIEQLGNAAVKLVKAVASTADWFIKNIGWIILGLILILIVAAGLYFGLKNRNPPTPAPSPPPTIIYPAPTIK